MSQAKTILTQHFRSMGYFRPMGCSDLWVEHDSLLGWTAEMAWPVGNSGHGQPVRQRGSQLCCDLRPRHWGSTFREHLLNQLRLGQKRGKGVPDSECPRLRGCFG